MFVCWVFILCSVPCSDILEECTAFMCRVTEFVQVAGEVTQWEMMFWLYSKVWGSSVHEISAQWSSEIMMSLHVSLFEALKRDTFGILNSHWPRTILSRSHFCNCDWPKSHKLSCITDTSSSSTSLKHPPLPVQSVSRCQHPNTAHSLHGLNTQQMISIWTTAAKQMWKLTVPSWGFPSHSGLWMPCYWSGDGTRWRQCLAEGACTIMWAENHT